MQRLTCRSKSKECRIVGNALCPAGDYMYELGLYRTYMNLNNPCENCSFKKVINKLAEYEDKEEKEKDGGYKTVLWVSDYEMTEIQKKRLDNKVVIVNQKETTSLLTEGLDKLSEEIEKVDIIALSEQIPLRIQLQFLAMAESRPVVIEKEHRWIKLNIAIEKEDYPI